MNFTLLCNLLDWPCQNSTVFGMIRIPPLQNVCEKLFHKKKHELIMSCFPSDIKKATINYTNKVGIITAGSLGPSFIPNSLITVELVSAQVDIDNEI